MIRLGDSELPKAAGVGKGRDWTIWAGGQSHYKLWEADLPAYR